MRKKKFKHLFVDTIPVNLQGGILYVSLRYNMVSHLCACGCGHRIDTPIAPDEWQMVYDGESITIRPSIGNWDLPCQSHYFITQNIAIPISRKRRRWLFFFF